MNAYRITYKATGQARTKHACVRFYTDYDAAYANSRRVLAETYPDVVILSVEPIADPRNDVRDLPAGELLTPEAAERLGVTRGRVNQLIWAGQLDARKLGRDWLVDTESITRYQAIRRPPGRQRKEQA